jgi:hypothetical protein
MHDGVVAAHPLHAQSRRLEPVVRSGKEMAKIRKMMALFCGSDANRQANIGVVQAVQKCTVCAIQCLREMDVP